MGFAQTKSPYELKRITKDVFKNYGQNFVEILRMSKQDKETLKTLIRFEGEEHLRNSIANGRGTILLAMHFGNWEMANISASLLNHPYKVMVKAQEKYSFLQKLLNSYRSFGGLGVLSRGMGTRDLIKALRNNEMVGIVVDQGGKDGINIPFLGRNASFADGAVRLSLKGNIPICFSMIIREKECFHRVIFHKPIEFTRTDDFDADVKNCLKKIVEIAEEYIKRYPEQYMWFYKVWKYSDEANIAILDDGRTGHLRQSETVAAMIQKALREREKQSSIEVVQIVFKSRISRVVFSVLGFFPLLRIFTARVGFLRHFLTQETYNHLKTVKADFVISCGSMTAGVNRFLSLDSRAKSIHILRPATWGYHGFDAVFLPYHDFSYRLSRYRNITQTIAAPNLINEDYLNKQKGRLLERYPDLKNNQKFKIGLLIGGDAKDVYLSEDQIKTLIYQIRDFCLEHNVDVLCSTSRRTPVKIEEFICNELKNKDYCPALILANEHNIPEAIGGILGLCDAIVVSGDSISMVSEAASSGKTVIIFPAILKEKTSQENKHQEFIEGLHKEGFVIYTQTNTIGESIFDVMKGILKTKKINDQDIVFATARHII